MKRKTLKKMIAAIMTVVILLGMCSWNLDSNTKMAEASEALRNPRRDTNGVVTYDCVWFGRYPQAKVITTAMYKTNSDPNLKDDDLVVDDNVYQMLKEATDWDENGDITLSDGNKYRRIKKGDAYPTIYYHWEDDTTYHYFKYQPIKWRVLSTDGVEAFLLADRALDSQPYNTSYTDITWAECTLRSWLNGYGSKINKDTTDYTRKNFINIAFYTQERNVIKSVRLKNKDNLEHGVKGGKSTKDKLFLLSGDDVTNEKYGFYADSSEYYRAGRVKASTYAKAIGAYLSTSSRDGGNTWWALRSPGIEANCSMYMNSSGQYDYYNGVYNVSTSVVPALYLKLGDTSLWSYAGTVSTDGSSTEGDLPPDVEKDGPDDYSPTLRIGTNIGFTVPEDVPLIGGETIGLNLSSVPVQFEKTGNTYKIGIGISNLKDFKEKDWHDFKKFIATQSDNYRKGINGLIAGCFGTASVGGSGGIEVSCYGYAEGVITDDDEIQSCDGQIALGISYKFGKQWQTWVVIPVVIKLDIEVGVETSSNISVDWDDKSVYVSGVTEITLPKIRLSAGAGIAYVADVSVYGSADNTITVTNGAGTNGKSENNIKAALNGEVGVSAKVFFASAEKTLLSPDEPLEYFNSDREPGVDLYSADYNISPEEYEYHIERNNSIWQGENSVELMSVDVDKHIQTLAKNVYNDTEPILLQTQSGVKVLVYTTDISSRTNGNHTAIVYSVYNENSDTWSKPVVIDDDGTADLYPSAAVCGDDVVVAWSNCKKKYTTEETEQEQFLTDVAENLDIKAATINMQNNNINIKQLTDDAYMDMKPSVASKGEDVFISWYKNTGNDIFELTGSNTIQTARKKGNSWNVSELMDLTSPVVELRSGYLQGKPVIAYIKNMDEQQRETFKRTLVLVDLQGNETCIDSDKLFSGLSFADINGEHKLLWYMEENGAGNLSYIESLNSKPQKLLPEDNHVTKDYSIISGEARDVLLYTEDKAVENGKDICAYILENGRPNDAINLTALEGYAERPVGIYGDGIYTILFLNKNVKIGKTSLNERTDLCVCHLKEHENLHITGVDYDEAKMLPGCSEEIRVDVKNDGLVNCKSYKIEVTDGNTLLGSIDGADAIAVGETKTCNVPVKLPDNMSVEDTYTVRLVFDSGEDTETIKPGFMDLELDVEESEAGYVVKVDNRGVDDVAGKLVLYDKDTSGRILKEIPLGIIAKGETVTQEYTEEELRAFGESLCISVEASGCEELLDCNNRAYIYVGDNTVALLDHLTADKAQTDYNLGEELDLSDLDVSAVYDNGDKKAITEFTTNVEDIDMSVAGNKTLVITYEERGIVKNVSLDIKVAGRKIKTITLSGSSKKVTAGEKLALAASITPDDAENKTITWRSSNSSYATVDKNGVVTTNKAGAGKTVIITAAASDGSNVSASYQIDIIQPVTVVKKNGLVKENGTYYYYKNNVKQTKYTGLILHTDKTWCYVKSGAWQPKYKGMVKHTNGKWYYVENGRKKYITQLVKHTDGTWWYVKNGEWQPKFKGMVKQSSGKWYYVENGKREYVTQLVKHTDGTWWYVKKSDWQPNYKGIVKQPSGRRYYVEKGKRKNITGNVKVNGKTYRVVNGEVK